MIVPRDQRQIRPLLGPRFEDAGPYAPGNRIPVALPLQNEGRNDERNLLVRFHGEGVTLDPEEVRVEHLSGGGALTVRTTATVLPAQAPITQISVWAELTSAGARTLSSTSARGLVMTRARLHLHFNAATRILTVANQGNLDTVVHLDFTPAQPDATVPFEFDLTANSNREVPIGGYAGAVTAWSAEGERAVLRVAPHGEGAPEVAASFRLDTTRPARYGDLAPFTLLLEHRSGGAADAVAFDLPLPSGLTPCPELFSLDDVRLLPADCAITEERLFVRLGRLEAGRAAVLRGAFLINADRRDTREAIELEGSVAGERLAPQVVRATVALDRTPLVSLQQSYLGEFEHHQDSAIGLTATITYLEPLDSERAHLRLAVDGGQVTGARDCDEQLPLYPSTVAGRPTMLVGLGTLKTDSRRCIRLTIAPTPSSSDTHHLRVRAALLADGQTIDLGEREAEIPGVVRLEHSSVETAQSGDLRLGMPVSVRLIVRNEGTVPARDVRLALDLPDAVDVSLPQERQGRWWPLVSAIPPGGMAALPLTLTLTQSLGTPRLEVAAELDAANAPATTLAPFYLRTPSAALLQVSTPLTMPAPHGLVAVAVRITNLGDGSADNVRLAVPADSHPMPRTTSVDEVAIDEDGSTPIIVRGLTLGTIAPGAYRDVAWLAAPGHDPYVVTVRVESDTEDPISVQSHPMSLPARLGLASALPPARSLDDREAVAPQTPAPTFTIHVERPEPTNELPPADGENALRALGAGREDAAGMAAPETPPMLTERIEETPGPAVAPHTEAAAALSDGEDAHAVTAAGTTGAKSDGGNAATMEGGVPVSRAPESAGEPTVEIAPEQGASDEVGELEARHGAQAHAFEPNAPTFSISDLIDIDASPSTFTAAPETTSPGSNGTGTQLPSFFGTTAAPTLPSQAPEAPPESRVTSEPLAGDAKDLFVHCAPLLADLKNCGAWPHALLLRYALPSQYTQARDSVEALTERLAPLLSYGPEANPTPTFISAATSYDEQLRNDLALHDIVCARESSAALDAQIARIVPIEIETTDEQVAFTYHEYASCLREFFTSDIISERDDGMRNLMLSTQRNVTLDDALGALLRTLSRD